MRVAKWHGAGNDFVVVDGRDARLPEALAAWTQRLCDRRRGVGADGLLVLEADDEHDFRMHYRNADGGEAAMCGNGGRVLAAYAQSLGLGRGGALRFRSRWGVHEARVERHGAHRFEVELTLPDVPPAEAATLAAPWGPVRALLVACGVPHAVVAVEDTPLERLEAIPVAAWGPSLRAAASLGAEGANVDFVARLADGGFAVRTFERGVEGETLACGTGATATAAAAVRRWGARSPVRVGTRGGDTLTVSFTPADGGLAAVRLRGPATRVFEAEVELG